MNPIPRAVRFAASPLNRIRSTPRRQRGQAIVWLLGTLAVSAAVLYSVYSVSQVTSGKAKAVNAADAAALAGANVEARLLNLVAYNNRSMMGNEVFLVQMLSIESWLGYVRSTADNVGTILQILGIVVPALEAVGQLLDRIADVIEEVRDDAVNPAIDGIITALELSKSAFGLAHRTVLAGGGVLAESAASRVVEANRANFGVHTDRGVEMDDRVPVRALTTIANNTQFVRFTRQYTGNDRTDARDILLASRDAFSANRPGMPWTDIEVPLVAGLEKSGSSRLVNFERWEVEDTLDLWHWDMVKMERDYDLPVGWGRANADRRGSAGNRWRGYNSWTESAAYNDGRSHSHDDWTGVPAVFDIRDKTRASRATLGLDFVVAVRRPQANNMTSDNLGLGGQPVNSPAGSAEMPERLHNNQLGAMAKARVSFERPRRNNADRTGTSLFRGDSAKEYGSLFSPYWQARLVDFTMTEKAAMMTAMGVNPVLAPLTPGARL